MKHIKENTSFIQVKEKKNFIKSILTFKVVFVEVSNKKSYIFAHNSKKKYSYINTSYLCIEMVGQQIYKSVSVNQYCQQ